MVRDVRDPDAQAAALGALRARCDAVEAAAAGRGDAVGTLDDGEIPPRWREPPFGDVSVESAGGVASTGMFNGSVQRMLDLVPTNIHERCPVILGSKRDVDMVLDRYK